MTTADLTFLCDFRRHLSVEYRYELSRLSAGRSPAGRPIAEHALAALTAYVGAENVPAALLAVGGRS